MLAWTLSCLCLLAPADRPLLEWRFDQPGQLGGWAANAHCADVRVADGALHVRCIDGDPILYAPAFELPATPWQAIELELRADRPGRGQIFWSGTREGRFGGYSAEKQTPFPMRGTGQWETIRVRPFWHAEQKIIQLRVDLVDGQTVDLRRVAIVAPDLPPPAATAAWDLLQAPPPHLADRLTVTHQPGDGLMLTIDEPEALWLLGPLAVPAESAGFVTLRLRADLSRRAALVWVTDRRPGLQRLDFSLRADGVPHVYNLDVGAQPGWTGTILALGLSPAAKVQDELTVQSLALADEPRGPADLELLWFGPDRNPTRGLPAELVAYVANWGLEPGEAACAVTGPAGLTIAPLDPPAHIEPEETTELRFRVTGPPGPVDAVFELTLGAGPTAQRTSYRLTTTPAAPRPADYVPPPRPATTDYLIGTYYFPGWHNATRWEPIRAYGPWRKPLLGWYDEGQPEIIDWQIKWAVEHGIRLFLVDWYWVAGRTSLMHWLEAFERARYRDQLQWAVMWANHNPAGTHSVEDWRAVTRFWLDHYFRQPNYYRLDGQPVVYLWSPHNLRDDLGGSDKVAPLLEESRQMARAAGLPGVRFMAMNEGRTEGEARRLKAEGYLGHASYHWWEHVVGRADDPLDFPFSLVADRARPAWEERAGILDAAGLLFQPTVDTGWDSRPWHGERARVIRDRTPELFERTLRDAKALLDARGQRTVILGPWNEWGEGSYIEPNREYGFAMLEAVRRVFCAPEPDHRETIPEDIGRGPYDLPPAPVVTNGRWDFAAGAQGWAPLMNLSGFEVADGVLKATTGARDPAFAGPPVRLAASRWAAVTIKLKIAGPPAEGQALQLFWGTAAQPISEGSSVRCPLVADGQWHDYTLPLAGHPRWRGTIRQLRLDPGELPGRALELASIVFQPRP